MSVKVLFACSKCFSRHPFEELSSGTQLCKACRGSSSSSAVMKCSYCRSEFQANSKSQSVCKKCEHNLGKYGKPSACECCKIVAAFGGPKCMRCASYEARYGPPGQCDECKLRSAFDRREENKKINGKLLCWLCTCAYKRAWLKAQQEGRISTKKRPHEKSHRDSSSSAPSKKPSRSGSEITKGSSGSTNIGATAANSAGLDLPEKISRATNSGNGMGTLVAPAVITIDPNSADHVVALTTLKERIASLERRLVMKDKELLEKDKLLTELKGKNFEKENEMRNKIRDIDRLNDMKVDNLNRKITTLLKEVAGLKRANKKNGPAGGSAAAAAAAKEKRERDNRSPKEELPTAAQEICDKDEPKSEDGDLKSEEEDRKSEGIRKSDEDSRDSAVSAKEIPKEENLKQEEEETKDNIEPAEKKETEETEEDDDENKQDVEKSRSRSPSRSRSRSRSGSGSNSRSASRSRSRSRSRSKSRSKSHSRSQSRSQSRSRSGSRSHSGSRSPSRSRSNSAESN